MVRAQRTQLTLVAAALVAGTVAMACGGGDEKDPTGTPTPDAGDTTPPAGGTLTLAFNPMYSAYDGSHTFKLPVKVTGFTGKLTVTTNPPDFVDADPTTDGVMLTMRKSGDTQVIIKDEQGNSGTAELHVTKNDPGDVDVGAERYTMGGDAFTLPEGGFMFPEGGFTFPEGGFGDGGFRLPEGGLANFDSGITRNENASCTFCHVPDGAGGGTMEQGRADIEHTPQQIGGYSDQDLIAIFTEGKKPEGAKFRIVNLGGLLSDTRAAGVYAMFHKWTVDPAVQRGIIAYLRQLTPKAQPGLDFGALLPMRPRPAGGTTTGTGATMDAGASTGP